MSRFAVLPVALILLLTAAMPVAAAAPVQSTTTGTFTLADAIFEYENFDVYDGDCGDFVLLVDFDVVRSGHDVARPRDPPCSLRGPFLQRLGHLEVDRPQRRLRAHLPIRRGRRASRADFDRAVRVRRSRRTPGADDRRPSDDGLRI